MFRPASCDLVSIVYFCLGLLVQALMSWDGGATQGITHALQKADWSPFEQGLIVSLDRFPGVVISATFWSYALSHWPTKPLLLASMFFKAVACAFFGRLNYIDHKKIMMVARFFMGFWESLFTVWIMAWISHKASQKNKVNWNNWLQMAAGAGSNLGNYAASTLEKNFGMAYEFQAVVLSSVFLFAVVLPSDVLALPRTGRGEGTTPLLQQLSTESVQQTTNSTAMARMGVEACAWNAEDHGIINEEDWAFGKGTSVTSVERSRSFGRFFISMGCAWSLISFTTLGFNALWQNTACDVWGFQPWQASITMILIGSIGGTAGMIYGKQTVDRWLCEACAGGDQLMYDEMVQRHDRTRLIQAMSVYKRISRYIMVLGGMCSILLWIKIQRLVQMNLPDPVWGVLLASLIITLVALYYWLSALQAFLWTENLDALPSHLHARATGYLVVAQNLLGYGLGADLPAEAATLFGHFLKWRWPGIDAEVMSGCQFAFGMSVVFLAGGVVYAAVARGAAGALAAEEH